MKSLIQPSFSFEAHSSRSRKLSFRLQGQTIVGLKLEHGYPDAPSSHSDLQQLALDVQSALMKGMTASSFWPFGN